MIEKCNIFEQVRLYVGSLQAGLPSAAARFRKGILDTVRLYETCRDVCDKRSFPLSGCCKTVYLDCGTILRLGEVDETFELVRNPRHGTIGKKDFLTYTPYEDFVGDDGFAYRMGGIYTEVCIEVVELEVDFEVESISEFLNQVTITTNCENPDIEWSEEVDGEGSQVIIPKGVSYEVTVFCGECFETFQPCVTCDIASSPDLPSGMTATAIHTFSGEVVALEKDGYEIEDDLQTVVDGEDFECGDPDVKLVLVET